MFEHQLQEIVDIRGVHDFHTFLRDCRPASADRHIRKQFSYTFESRNGEIFLRTKRYCGANTPWGPWAQILPFPGTDVVHEPYICPPMQAPKPWNELRDVIVPNLQRFYYRHYPHPVHIPEGDLDAMRTLHSYTLIACLPTCLPSSPKIYSHLYYTHFLGPFLRGEVPPHEAPRWIQWDVDDDLPALIEDDESEPASPIEDPFEDDEWEPILQPRKRARTDTVDEGEEESEDEEEEDEGEAVEVDESFPYPVGTKVARDFDEHGIFWGVIEKHYPDDPNICLVRFTDGDSEDLDRDEIAYAIQLYEQVFAK